MGHDIYFNTTILITSTESISNDSRTLQSFHFIQLPDFIFLLEV